MTPEQRASVTFDMACLRTWGAGAGKQVALILDVSEPTVSRWRRPDYHETPTTAHIEALGPQFVLAHQKSQSDLHGFGKAALAALLESMGDVAVLTA